MASVDPYTSRLESGMRLLTDRLAHMDSRVRALVAENEALRAELDWAAQRTESAARERAREILAAAEAREPVAASDVDRYREQLARQATALHEEARARIERFRARGGELAAGPETWPPPQGDPVADYPPPLASAAADDAALRARAAALETEIEALIELRATVVSSIRATLLGLAERLAEAERNYAAS